VTKAVLASPRQAAILCTASAGLVDAFLSAIGVFVCDDPDVIEALFALVAVRADGKTMASLSQVITGAQERATAAAAASPNPMYRFSIDTKAVIDAPTCTPRVLGTPDHWRLTWAKLSDNLLITIHRSQPAAASWSANWIVSGVWQIALDLPPAVKKDDNKSDGSGCLHRLWIISAPWSGCVGKYGYQANAYFTPFIAVTGSRAQTASFSASFVEAPMSTLCYQLLRLQFGRRIQQIDYSVGFHVMGFLIKAPALGASEIDVLRAALQFHQVRLVEDICFACVPLPELARLLQLQSRSSDREAIVSRLCAMATGNAKDARVRGYLDHAGKLAPSPTPAQPITVRSLAEAAMAVPSSPAESSSSSSGSASAAVRGLAEVIDLTSLSAGVSSSSSSSSGSAAVRTLAAAMASAESSRSAGSESLSLGNSRKRRRGVAFGDGTDDSDDDDGD